MSKSDFCWWCEQPLPVPENYSHKRQVTFCGPYCHFMWWMMKDYQLMKWNDRHEDDEVPTGTPKKTPGQK